MKKALKIKIVTITILVFIAAILVWWLVSGTKLHLEKNGKLEITPTQIEKIRNIGQWEFLSVSDEEIVDTIRHGFFGDDELSRIYYGTLRFGIDLSETGENWITMDKDTVVVSLPAAKLLDENFIDEARTKSFIEDGKWTEADRAALTKRAIALMRKRCVTKQNLDKTEENARKQVTTLLKSMGFPYIRIKP